MYPARSLSTLPVKYALLGCLPTRGCLLASLSSRCCHFLCAENGKGIFFSPRSKNDKIKTELRSVQETPFFPLVGITGEQNQHTEIVFPLAAHMSYLEANSNEKKSQWEKDGHKYNNGMSEARTKGIWDLL